MLCAIARITPKPPTILLGYSSKKVLRAIACPNPYACTQKHWPCSRNRRANSNAVSCVWNMRNAGNHRAKIHSPLITKWETNYAPVIAPVLANKTHTIFSGISHSAIIVWDTADKPNSRVICRNTGISETDDSFTEQEHLIFMGSDRDPRLRHRCGASEPRSGYQST